MQGRAEYPVEFTVIYIYIFTTEFTVFDHAWLGCTWRFACKCARLGAIYHACMHAATVRHYFCVFARLKLLPARQQSYHVPDACMQLIMWHLRCFAGLGSEGTYVCIHMPLNSWSMSCTVALSKLIEHVNRRIDLAKKTTIYVHRTSAPTVVRPIRGLYSVVRCMQWPAQFMSIVSDRSVVLSVDWPTPCTYVHTVTQHTPS